MSRRVVTVALLLITGLVSDAAATEGPKNTSKKVNKLNAYLEKIGINSPEIKAFSQMVQERTEGDYIRLSEERYEYGRLVLFYEIDPHVTAKQLQLKFQPNNSNMEYTASTRGVMASYHYDF